LLAMTSVIGLQLTRSYDDSLLVQTAPLKHLDVAILVVDRVSQHTLTQTYVNSEPTAIEAKYVFPLPESACISKFYACFSGGKKLEGVIKDRTDARQAYEHAIHHGAQAVMLEEERPDVFQASIGSIQPGEEVTVTLRYDMELSVENDALRLTIPSHVAPRYSPATSLEDDRANQISEVFQNLTSSSNIVGGQVAFSAKIKCEVSKGSIERIHSPTHPASISWSGQYRGSELLCTAEAVVNIASGGLDNDIVVCIKPTDLFEPLVAWEEWAEHETHALMLSFVPKFELPMLEKVEVVFVLDCSGSMSGVRIEQSKRAMQIFMRSLPPQGCCFNIVKFGSSFKAMSSNGCVPYNDTNLQAASSYIEEIGADMGGTEIGSALRFVREQTVPLGHSRQIFVLTDGQVRNEQEVIDSMRGINGRIFFSRHRQWSEHIPCSGFGTSNEWPQCLRAGRRKA
jgi:hypothetical protein